MLKKLEHDYSDLIISDIMMPVMDGYELVASVLLAPCVEQPPFQCHQVLSSKGHEPDFAAALLSL